MFLLVTKKQKIPLFSGLQMYKLSPIMQTQFLDLFKAYQCASSQLSPIPISTVNGTRSE